MRAAILDLSLQKNHVFVDFENVHQINLAVIESRAVSFTLLVGPRQTKLDVSLVEKLFEHAHSVQLVRLTSAGQNALDFTLAYYLGRAVAADPTGCFHIISKDTGFNPLIEHLQSRHIHACRHDSFATLPFAGSARPPAPAALAAAPRPKSSSKARPPSLALQEQAARVLEHLRKPSANRPRTKLKLVSFLIAHLGHKVTDAGALELIDYLCQRGHFAIGEKGAVTYYLEPK